MPNRERAMSWQHCEKIVHGYAKPGEKRHQKKKARKARRLTWKKLGEDAPTKNHYHGSTA